MLQTKTFVGGILHPGQYAIASEIVSSPAMFFAICTPRQWGKSFMAQQLILSFALNAPQAKLMFASPTYSQSLKIFNEIVNAIQDSGAVKSINRSELEIIFLNDSQALFKSVQLPDNLRGYSEDFMILDEAASYKKDTFNAVLRPMLAVRGKKCVLLSTPKGKNYFYDLYKKGLDENETRYRSFKGCTADNPYANLQEIEDARKSLPDLLFRQEYEAEFLDGGGSVFQGLDKIANLQFWQDPIEGEKYFGGLDIAITGDYLVLTILNSKGEVVNSYRDHGKPMQLMISNIKTMLDKYNPKKTYVEINGIGGGIFDYIKKTHRSVEAFTTTNKTKQNVIEDLIYEVQNESIKIPQKQFYEYYFEEMGDFGFVYSPKTRTVVYKAMNGHDDCVISLALALHAKKFGATTGTYVIDNC